MIYEPAEDSYLLSKWVKLFSKDKSILDVGSGSGIQALSALKSGAKKVTASDISEEAVKHVSSIGIKCIKSDLFARIKGKFDLIVFNPPYLPEDKDEDRESGIITSGGKEGDELTIRFLKSAYLHLKKRGEILLLISSLTPKKIIVSTIKSKYLSYKILEKQSMFMESIEVWKIKAQLL